MAYDENGEWVDENYGTEDWRDSSHDSYDITPSDNADDHGEIKQPDAPPSIPQYDPNQLIAEGRSITRGQADQYLKDAKAAGVPDSFVSEFLKRDPNDYNRLISGYRSQQTGGGGGGSKLIPSSSGGGGGNGGGNSNGGRYSLNGDEIYGYLKGLFPGGGFNQDIVNRRLDSVKTGLDAQRKSTQKNNEAYLADRGLIGSGPQASANESLESRLFGQFGQAYNDIYADEANNADSRMIAALSAATGMNESEAAHYIDEFRANTERDLGFGNLAARNRETDLGYYRAGNDYSLGQGNLALGNYRATNDYNLGAQQNATEQDKLAELIRQHGTDTVLELLRQGLTLDEIAARGYETSHK